MLYPEVLGFLVFGLVVSVGLIFYIKRSGKKEESRLQEGVQDVDPSANAASTDKPSLNSALEKTRQSIFKKIESLYKGETKLLPHVGEALEEILYTSDVGPKAAETILEKIKKEIPQNQSADLETLKSALKRGALEILQSTKQIETQIPPGGPSVFLIVGVNGAGKTTTIGKLAHYFSQAGKKVMVVAADTFRAAAEQQLKVWADRAGVLIYQTSQTSDPSAVAYQGVEKGLLEKADVIIVDTAGRLHNKAPLMDELKKIKRVIQKVIPQAPHSTLLVVDAHNGQNAISQAKTFHEALELTGLVITKLDGTAKGGVVLGIAQEVGLQPEFIGLGEGIEDLERFSSQKFADALFG